MNGRVGAWIDCYEIGCQLDGKFHIAPGCLDGLGRTVCAEHLAAAVSSMTHRYSLPVTVTVVPA